MAPIEFYNFNCYNNFNMLDNDGIVRPGIMRIFRKCMRTIKKLLYRFMNFKIGTKMTIVYIVIILIPTFLYSIFFYLQISRNITSMYATGNQQLMEQSYSNLKKEITQLESVYQLFQYNKSVIEFLGGYYRTEADEIYAYLKDIKPLFAYGHASNSNIEEITIYKYLDSLTTFDRYILGVERFEGRPEILDAIPPGKGIWVFNDEAETDLTYYKKCYSANYYRELGFIQISVKSSNLLDVFSVSDSNQKVLFQHNEKWYSIQDGSMKEISASDTINPTLRYFFESGLSDADGMHYPANKKVLVNSLQIEELGVKAVLLTPVNMIAGNFKEYTPLIYLAVLLIILSFIYYIIISSITNRMTRLAGHITKTDHENLRIYNGGEFKDEIGAVIKAYNDMVNRIGSLLKSLNIAELKKKEANFHALQAQIRPHFIYNALETIRMMAEANDDPRVADITYSLGRFMRYNLSGKKDDTMLKDEIEHVHNYLQIYRVSMSERLIFNINIRCDIDQVKCPVFILQPLVENSLRHGLSNNREKCIIEIDTYEEDDFIIIRIHDNGIGIEIERLKIIKGALAGSIDPFELQPRGNGIGIVNVNERIRSYFGNRSGLAIESESGKGTTCIIKLEKTRGGFIDAVADRG